MKETHSPMIGGPATSKLKNLLPHTTLTALWEIQATHLYPNGFHLFLEGQSPRGVYVLHSGCVELTVTDDHGRQMVLAKALPGDILGLSAVVSGKFHEETAVVTIPCRAGFVACEEFHRFVGHHPEAAFWVVQLLSEQLTATLEQLSFSRHTHSVAARQ